MSDHQREIYHSENGDRCFLCRDDAGRPFILHKANVSSGAMATKIELGDFLGKVKAGREHQALARLIGSLVNNIPDNFVGIAALGSVAAGGTASAMPPSNTGCSRRFRWSCHPRRGARDGGGHHHDRGGVPCLSGAAVSAFLASITRDSSGRNQPLPP